MTYGKRPPLDEQKALFEATVAAEGVTTLAGEGTGLSLIDAGLAGAGANSFVSMMAVIHPGDPQNVDSKDITAFDDGTGEVTVASAFKGGQVAAGVSYKIVTFRFTPAEVAAIEALLTNADYGLAALHGDIGDKGAGVDIITRLGAFTAAQNLKAILGDLSTTKNLGGILGAFTTAANLKAAIDAIKGAGWTDENLTTIDSLIDTLLTRVTAAVALASSLTTHETAQATHRTALGTHDTAIKALLATIDGIVDTLLTRITAAVATAANLATHEASQSTHRTALGTHETAQATHRTALGTHETAQATSRGAITNIKTQTDKLAGAAPGVGTATENWNAAENDIVSIGANDTKNKLHSLLLNISALTATATITIRMYMQVNGVERKVYDQDFVKDTDPDGLWIVNGMVGIHEVLRVTAQSDNAGDDGKTINYDYMLEVM